MIYKLDLSPISAFAAPAASGFESPADIVQFVPWQPSAWPDPPADFIDFTKILKRIFEVSMLMEINNVIEDSVLRTGNLEHRGHVVALSLFCALDAISSYGYRPRSGKQIPDFIRAHFCGAYKPHADNLLNIYRHALVHSWNLFAASISPNDEPISARNGIISFGLLNFFDALKNATEDFLEKLANEQSLQDLSRSRYNGLRETAIKLIC